MVVDASVWVSGLVSEDTHHKATNAWLSQRLAGGDTLNHPFARVGRGCRRDLPTHRVGGARTAISAGPDSMMRLRMRPSPYQLCIVT